MSRDREDRLRAGRAIARALADPDVRRMYARNGYRSGQQIVATLEEDLLADVIARVTSHQPPVLVAIYHPTKDSLRYFTVMPGDPSDVEVGDSHVGGTTTIGMLADYLERREGSNFTFRYTDPTFDGVNVDRLAVFA